jgi:hypothetical protein
VVWGVEVEAEAEVKVESVLMKFMEFFGSGFYEYFGY